MSSTLLAACTSTPDVSEPSPPAATSEVEPPTVDATSIGSLDELAGTAWEGVHETTGDELWIQFNAGGRPTTAYDGESPWSADTDTWVVEGDVLTVEVYFGPADGTGTYVGTLADDGASLEMTLTVSGTGESERITLRLDT